jgi:hypothetical protein
MGDERSCIPTVPKRCHLNAPGALSMIKFCSSGMTLILPQHSSGTPSDAKIFLFIQKSVRFICVASIVRAKRALIANDEPVKVQFQKLGDGVDECVVVCDKSPEDTRTADATVIPFSLRNNFPSRCCWPLTGPASSAAYTSRKAVMRAVQAARVGVEPAEIPES